MNREQKCGAVLIAIGVLTVPFLFGVALLPTGILLLVKGDRINTDRWIRRLFWIGLAAVALALALMFIVDIEGQHSAERGIALSYLCVSPLLLTTLAGTAMATLTIIRFRALSRRFRIMGLSFAVLGVLGISYELVDAYPEPTIAIGLLLTGVWAFVAWRKKRHSRRAEALRHPPAEAVEFAPPLESPEPVAQRPEPSKPPRVRKPVCGIIAWLLPVLALPIGFLIGWLADSSHLEGFQAWAILAWALLPLFLALCISPVLAIVSLLRRERHPWLALVMLLLYATSFALFGIAFIHDSVGEGAALATFAVCIATPVAWIVWRRMRQSGASG